MTNAPETHAASATLYRARIYVSLKSTVNDPEGETIASALRSLGFDSVQSVRSGKYFQVLLSAASEQEARAAVDAMCRRLLANPVIETYEFELREAQPA